MSRTGLTVIFLLFACVGTLPAQSTFGSLSGGGVDPGRAEVLRAIVTPRNRDTIVRLSTPCDAGNYTLTNLRPGTCAIAVLCQNAVAQASADAAHLLDHGPDHGPDTARIIF